MLDGTNSFSPLGNEIHFHPKKLPSNMAAVQSLKSLI